MTAAKRFLHYVKYTADFLLHSNANDNGNGIDTSNGLAGYSDSNCANDSTDQKSHQGHVFLASNGGAISSESQKQSLISMSTLESKLNACSEGSREANWLFQLQKDIHSKDLPLLPINCDNQGALTLIPKGIHKA